MKRPFIIAHHLLADTLQSVFGEGVLCQPVGEDLQSHIGLLDSIDEALGLWLSTDQWRSLFSRSDQSMTFRRHQLNVELLLPTAAKAMYYKCWPLDIPTELDTLLHEYQWLRLIDLQTKYVQSMKVLETDYTTSMFHQHEATCLEMISPLRALSQKIAEDQDEARNLCYDLIEIVETERTQLDEFRKSLESDLSQSIQVKDVYSLRVLIEETLQNLSCPLSWYKTQNIDFAAEVLIEETRRSLNLLISQVSLFDSAPSITINTGNNSGEAVIEIITERPQKLSAREHVRFEADLTYIRENAEKQGGALQIHSTMNGVVKLSWIFSGVSELEVKPSLIEDKPMMKSHIWLIDDEPGVRLTVKRWLVHLGYSVEVFEEGHVLLNALEVAQLKPALIVCDADMPVMTGLEVLSKISKKAPQVKRLLYTAREPNRWVIEAFNQGVIHRFIDKSEGPTALQGCIEELLKIDEQKGAQLQALDELLIDRMVTLHVQPIFSSESREVEAVEALMRSQHKSFRGPLDILNATQLAQREFDLQRVLTSLSRQLREAIPTEIKLFMNIDPIVFGHPDQLDDVFSEVYPYATSIVLELTERGQLCGDAWVESVGYLRDKGFEIALDDLGAGYNSLGAVAAVSPEIIKLDISLVSNVHLSNPKKEMMRLLSEYALRHGIKTVAEGIEVKEEAEVSTELGMKWLQGYHLDRPMPVDQFIRTYVNK